MGRESGDELDFCAYRMLQSQEYAPCVAQTAKASVLPSILCSPLQCVLCDSLPAVLRTAYNHPKDTNRYVFKETRVISLSLNYSNINHQVNVALTAHSRIQRTAHS